jgi:hypothetical protein|nr:MAG TPA: mHsp60, mHsp10, Mitochondrial, Chaperonin, Complex, Symmetric [Caudoviricetes sp.]
MKDARIKLTENEKYAAALTADPNAVMVNMSENTIDNIIEKENSIKFNNQVEAYNEQLEKNNKEFNESVDGVQYDINKAEIKPMFSRLIVKPFKQNPFQQMKIRNGLIVDAGGYTPHAQINPMTGKYEEQNQFIVTGCVVEVGPDTKYLKEGDVIYYRIDTAVPVPFFKQGFISIDEKQVIAVVNEGLTERFNNIK